MCALGMQSMVVSFPEGEEAQQGTEEQPEKPGWMLVGKVACLSSTHKYPDKLAQLEADLAHHQAQTQQGNIHPLLLKDLRVSVLTNEAAELPVSNAPASGPRAHLKA